MDAISTNEINGLDCEDVFWKCSTDDEYVMWFIESIYFEIMNATFILWEQGKFIYLMHHFIIHKAK